MNKNLSKIFDSISNRAGKFKRKVVLPQIDTTPEADKQMKHGYNEVKK